MLPQAAATSPAWQHQLDSMPAGVLASMLPLGSRRYSRLQQVASSRQQARRTMRGLLRMSDEAFQAFADKHLQQPPAAAAAAGALLAGGLAAGKGPLSILQMQLIADGLVVAPAKITINPIVDAGSSSTAGGSISGIRLRCGKADVSLRNRDLTHATLLEGLVRLCCCWSVKLEGYHMSEQQCATIRVRVPSATWELYAARCRWPRML